MPWCLEDRELNQARSKPDTGWPLVPLCTIIIVHNTVTQRQFFSIFLFLPTNITSQMWPCGGKEGKSRCSFISSHCSFFLFDLALTKKYTNQSVIIKDVSNQNKPTFLGHPVSSRSIIMSLTSTTIAFSSAAIFLFFSSRSNSDCITHHKKAVNYNKKQI